MTLGKFPDYRPRRMRQSEVLRRLVRETRLSLDQLVMPYFVREGSHVKEEIDAMPGQYRFSVDTILAELEELEESGIRAILLFGIPSQKDENATSAWSGEGIVSRAVREIKRRFPTLAVVTDVCLCAFTSHGHCGIINERGEIDNDASLDILAKAALSHAEAGADMVAPSDMMDGRIRRIREVLDGRGFKNLSILSYAAKFASAFYGPFRDATHSAPNPSPYPSPLGGEEGVRGIPADRKSYQMDPANREEALREIALDIEEGADMVMVKPALAYLDVLREAKEAFRFPLAAYAVSGEYAMVKAAAQKGWIDEKKVVLEMMTSLARAGADTLITYHTKQIALWNKESQLHLFEGVVTT